MASLTNGPKLWAEILSYFPPRTIIAGGAVRDFYFNLRPKDIDVFYPYTPGDVDTEDSYVQLVQYEKVQTIVNRFEYVIHKPLGPWFPDETYPSDNENAYLTDDSPLAFVEDLIYKDFKVNIMGVQNRDPVDHMYSFDFGINRALFDGNLFYTSDFMKDAMNETITWLNPGPKSAIRSKRLVNKFKGFKIVTKSGEDTPAVS